MSKTTFKDIKHFFTVTPDLLQVKGFANGIEGKLELSWQHPMLHTDEDNEQPAEGTNHIRIDVKTEWLPFNPDNIPEAKEGWLLLINDFDLDKIHSFKVYNGNWQIHPMTTTLNELIKMYGAANYKNCTYKLVSLT